MKVKFGYSDSPVTIEVEGQDTKEVFMQLAAAQEIFDQPECGACGEKNLRFIVRENGGYTYFEVGCVACNARLAFGQKREGGALFPKRKDKQGNYLPGNGWVKWSAKEDDEF